jgi:hypothetical protein
LKNWWTSFLRDGKGAGSIFLTTLPFGIFLVYLLALQHGPQEAAVVAVGRTLLMAIPAWLFVLLIWSLAVRQHMHLVLEVCRRDYGLEVRSLCFKKMIRWLEIRDLFPISDGEWLLDCKDDEYVLSNELTDSGELFDFIQANLSVPVDRYELNCKMNEDFFTSTNMATSAVCFALLSGVVSQYVFKTPNTALLVQSLPVLLLLIAPFALIWWINTFKVVRLLRIGSAGLYIRTRSTVQELSWDQVTHIKHIGGVFVIKSPSAWCLVMVKFLYNRKEVTNKLLEARCKLLSRKVQK